MKLTEKMLINLGACSGGMAWYRDRGADSVEETIERLIADKQYSYAIWLLPRMTTHRGRILMACYAARQALPQWEARYPDDNRPRLAIEAAERCADNDTEDNRIAAWCAASAVWCAASAAWCAARSAAERSAESVASSAACAVLSVASTNRSAAYTTIIREWMRVLAQEAA